MSIFAIGDLHLPGGDDKPMQVFGAHWEGHWEKIRADWRARVTGEDAVLIPGDISWAMHLEDALPDLRAIGELPGRKILLRGNHDYWWGAISRVRDVLPPGMYALQNDALVLDGVAFCGSRGWTYPQNADGEDARLYDRLFPAREAAVDFYRAEADRQGGSVLELGCGTGNKLIRSLPTGIRAWAWSSLRPCLPRLSARRTSAARSWTGCRATCASSTWAERSTS
jgi:hypothetical protein